MDRYHKHQSKGLNDKGGTVLTSIPRCPITNILLDNTDEISVPIVSVFDVLSDKEHVLSRRSLTVSQEVDPGAIEDYLGQSIEMVRS